MYTNPQRLNRRDCALSSLGAAIETMNLAKEVSRVALVKAAFGSVSILLTIIEDSVANKAYVELGLACADVCRALDPGTNGNKLDDPNQSMCQAIVQLTTIVAEIQEKVAEKGRGSLISRVFLVQSDRERIAAWKFDLYKILHIFKTELAASTKPKAVVSSVRRTHTIVPNIRRTMTKTQKRTEGRSQPIQVSTLPGEHPPPPPRVCLGRDELIEKIVGFARTLTPIALIGPGGTGKTSVALAVLHHDRIKQWFGDNRRFIRCDEFPASRAHFLSRLSKVIGAGVENPEDLTPLRSSLSSREMILFLDNAESILDPQGTDAREIHAVVEELSQFETLCLCITSRTSNVPRRCERLNIPTLSMGSACNIFFNIYDNGGWSQAISDLLRRLDLHPLSIALLATAASHNVWDYDRLAREWDSHRVQVPRTDRNEGLAATIELLLASPKFRELGSDARDLLGAIAFFPQGINENSLSWLFPTFFGRRNIFDKLCTLSLTYRRNGFVTMLAPLRDHLRPKDPTTSPLLRTTKERYFSRLSVLVDPGEPGFDEAQWIASEDVSVEHLLDVFTTIDANSNDVWDVCQHFMRHLFCHKPRLVVLGPKIEGLPDYHHSKPKCLLQLSQLFDRVGNRVECKRLLVHALRLWRERGDDFQVGQTLECLSDVNSDLDRHTEGIWQAEEALRIYERLNDKPGQARSWQRLAQLSQHDNQPDAAQEAALQAINLLTDNGDRLLVCQSHSLLGEIYSSKGETDKAIIHLNKALRIATPPSWHEELARIHVLMAIVFFDENRFDDANSHVERAKSHAINDAHSLGCAILLQAGIWYEECRFEEAKFEALRAAEVLETVGAALQLEYCREFLYDIDQAIRENVAPRSLGHNALVSPWLYPSGRK